jgi:hypothetical protein
MKLFIKEFKERFYWFVLVIILMLFVSIILLGSCSVQKSYANEAGLLMAPNKNDKLVIWCDYDYVYCINKPQNDSIITFKRIDIQNIRNENHDAIVVGTILICRDEFRNYYNRP